MTSSDLNPNDALGEIARAGRRVHRTRWWHVAAASVMALAMSAFAITLLAFPAALADLLLPGVVLVLGVLLLIGLRQRAKDLRTTRVEGLVLWLGPALCLVPMALNPLLADDLSPWTVLAGLPPGLPWAYLAWHVARKRETR